MLAKTAKLQWWGFLMLSLVILALGSGQVAAACDSEAGSDEGASSMQVASVHCGGAPSATLDEEGRLWVAFVQNKYVYVSYSDNLGKSYSSPVKVNQTPEDAEFNGENRPKIVVADNGDIMLSWTWKTSPNFTGEIRFSRSTDGGRNFETPRTINDDGLMTGHRFDSLFLTASNKLYLTWIDKRDLVASLAQGEDYVGAAIYYAVSLDHGATFSKNYRVANYSCECCRIAMAPYGEDDVAILWRQVFEETTRDHAFARLTPDGQVMDMARATYDDWQINACPHHGPSMIPALDDNTYHMTWFSNGNRNSGVYYGLHKPGQAQTAQLHQVDATPGAGHPFLASINDKLFIVWKRFNGEHSEIVMKTSSDNGASWSGEDIIIITGQGSDYPLLVRDDHALYLSWRSEEHGYVFREITN